MHNAKKIPRTKAKELRSGQLKPGEKLKASPCIKQAEMRVLWDAERGVRIRGRQGERAKERESRERERGREAGDRNKGWSGERGAKNH